jgi:hypothetical protein
MTQQNQDGSGKSSRRGPLTRHFGEPRQRRYTSRGSSVRRVCTKFRPKLVETVRRKIAEGKEDTAPLLGLAMDRMIASGDLKTPSPGQPT